MKRFATIVILLGLLTACAGRSPQPVQVTQSADRNLSCSEIDAEISANNQRINGLLAEEDDKRAQNIMAVAGAVLVFAPLIFAMDFQDAAGIERSALQERQMRLARLSSRRCGREREVIAATATEQQTEAVEVAAATRDALAYPPIPGSPPLFEGSSYAAFTPAHIQAYCQQSWTTRIAASGRTEYNPCTQRSAFR